MKSFISKKLHWSCYLQVIPFFIIAILFFVLGIGLFESLGTKSPGWTLAGVLTVIGGVIDIIYIRLLVRTSEFAVTNKRLIIKQGIISTKTLELLHSKIEAISISQGIGGKILGFGNFAVVGTGGTVHRFKAIEKPFDFRKAAQEEINKVQKKS
jgi:uncharacterized membrane protein YdbT with pleckstrin-like domain